MLYLVTPMLVPPLCVTSNVGLALTNRNYCVTELNVSFTQYSFSFPHWLFRITIILLLLSALTMLICWFSVAVRAWKRRSAETGIPRQA